MIRKKSGGLEWLEFEIFQNHPLAHGVFLRHGGVSAGIFSSLNMTLGKGDERKAVLENRQRALSRLNLSMLCGCRAVHGNGIEYVDSDSLSPAEGPTADGLITDKKEAALLIEHADCQAAIFYDPLHHALGSLHAGWRGQVAGIYQKMVRMMGERFNSRAQDLLVGISPSLGPTYSEFTNFANELPTTFLPFQFRPTYFDLWAISRHLLETAGVLPHHIEIASIDTYSNPIDFFSYRREKKQHGQIPGRAVTGGHGTLAALL